MRWSRLSLFGVVLATLLGVAGCDNKPKVEVPKGGTPLPSDSQGGSQKVPQKPGSLKSPPPPP
jgi:hypothetical protein